MTEKIQLKIKHSWADSRFLLCVVLLSFLSVTVIKAQIIHPGKPIGPYYDNGRRVKFYHVQSANLAMQKNVKKGINTIYLKNQIFGQTVDVKYSPSLQGTWDTLPDKTIIWRLGITSENASSLALIFNPFHLDSGCKLMVYSPSLREVYGAYTFRNNRDNDIFAITPVYDDSLIIELQLFTGVNNFGSLILDQIGVGFPIETSTKSTTDQWYRMSSECEVDVRCIDNPQIQNQKHSECRIVYHGSNRCTGTLINNTSTNGRPLFLTAAHCIESDIDAATSIIYFDYESPYCNGPDGPLKSLSGAKILSRDAGMDFALLEIKETPPLDYNPLYSGWDVTDEPFTHTYTYHHPEGDVKKIAENSGQVNSADYNLFDNSAGFDQNVHWLVQSYEIGTTEEGSSGAALFDTSFHMRGTLSGGSIGCGSDISDYYAMISHAWNDSSNIKHQLKHWLDPLNIDSVQCNNYDPVNKLFTNGKVLTNLDSSETKLNLRLKSGWGFISGHNSLGTTEYAEKYSKNGTKYVYALNMDIANDYTASINSKIDIQIWSGNEVPEDLLFSKEFLLFEMTPGEVNFLRLDTAIKVNDNFFIGYQIYYPDPVDSFSVRFAKPRESSSQNTAYSKRDGVWQQLTDGVSLLNTSLCINPLVFDFVPTINPDNWKLPAAELTLYPDPAYDYIQILLNQKYNGTVKVTVFDMLGRAVSGITKESPEPNFQMQISDLSHGMYIIKVEHPGGVNKTKFIKF